MILTLHTKKQERPEIKTGKLRVNTLDQGADLAIAIRGKSVDPIEMNTATKVNVGIETADIMKGTNLAEAWTNDETQKDTTMRGMVVPATTTIGK